MSNYNSQLQTNNTNLQAVLRTLQGKAAVGNAFPYAVTVNVTGIDDVQPIICYGDDGDTVIVLTGANKAGTYSASWTNNGCDLVLQMVSYDLGSWAVFNNFTKDAEISVKFTLSGGMGGQE